MSAAEVGAAAGLRFTGAALPGLIAGLPGELPEVAVELADADALDERWADAAASKLIFERRFSDGRPFLRVERDTGIGYRVAAVEHGTHLVTLDGGHCASALPEVHVRGLKLLAAQTIPLLATLRGREVLHAAGVVVRDQLVGIVAASGAGKSATACNVIAQDGQFFADDVIALEVVNGHVLAHPGTRLLNLYRHDFEAIPEEQRGRLGEALGESDKLHFAPPGFQGARPLAGLLFLRRAPDVATTAISPLQNAPAWLLGNAFLPYLDHAERLARQLEVMGRLANTVPLAELTIAPGATPPVLAGMVREWAAGLP